MITKVQQTQTNTNTRRVKCLTPPPYIYDEPINLIYLYLAKSL